LSAGGKTLVIMSKATPIAGFAGQSGRFERCRWLVRSRRKLIIRAKAVSFSQLITADEIGQRSVTVSGRNGRFLPTFVSLFQGRCPHRIVVFTA
jgi:hypothetical protein